MAYELIGIDNRGQKFSSCSRALNSVLSQVQTEYLIYAHQDIELPELDMLEQFVNYLKQIGEADILGVAGAAETSRVLQSESVTPIRRQSGQEVTIGDKAGTCVLSHVLHGDGLVCAGELEYTGLLECDTLDECFFGGRTETFRTESFDEKLCDNWHLYAVERCLRARVLGNRVWVCDLPLLHYSGGHINHAYNENFKRIAAHYAKLGASHPAGQIEWIRTTCGSAKVDWFSRTLFYWKRELLFFLHRM